MIVNYISKEYEQNFEREYYALKRNEEFEKAASLIRTREDLDTNILYQSELGYICSETGKHEEANSIFGRLIEQVNGIGNENMPVGLLIDYTVNNNFAVVNMGHPEKVAEVILRNSAHIYIGRHPKKDFFIANSHAIFQRLNEANYFLWLYLDNRPKGPSEELLEIACIWAKLERSVQFTLQKLTEHGLSESRYAIYLLAIDYFHQASYYEAYSLLRKVYVSGKISQLNYVCFLSISDCLHNVSRYQELKAWYEAEIGHYLPAPQFAAQTREYILGYASGIVDLQNVSARQVQITLLQKLLQLNLEEGLSTVIRGQILALENKINEALEILLQPELMVHVSPVRSILHAAGFYYCLRFQQVLDTLNSIPFKVVGIGFKHLLSMKAYSYYQLNEFENCISVIEEKRRSFDLYPADFTMLAQCLMVLNRSPQALELLESAISKYPVYGTFYLLKAEILGQSGDIAGFSWLANKGFYLDEGIYEIRSSLLINYYRHCDEPFVLQSAMEANNLYWLYLTSHLHQPHFKRFEKLNTYLQRLVVENNEHYLHIRILIYSIGNDSVMNIHCFRQCIETGGDSWPVPLLYFLLKDYVRYENQNIFLLKMIRESAEKSVSTTGDLPPEQYFFLSYIASYFNSEILHGYLGSTYSSECIEETKNYFASRQSSTYSETFINRNWGENAAADILLLTEYAVYREFFAPQESQHNFLDYFNLNETATEKIEKAVREASIREIVDLFSGSLSEVLSKQLTTSTDEEEARIKRMFITNDIRQAGKLYEDLEKYNKPDLSFEDYFGLQIFYFDLKFEEAYFQLIKLHYYKQRISITEALYLLFYTVDKAREKGFSGKRMQDAYEKGGEEFVKTSLKLFFAGVLRQEAQASEMLSLITTSTAAALAKLFISFTKTEKNTFLDKEDSRTDYQNFKAGFINYISFLYETMGEEKFYERYLTRFSNLSGQG